MKCLEASVLLFSIPKFSQTHSPRLSELEGPSDTRRVRRLTSQDSEGVCCAVLCSAVSLCSLWTAAARLLCLWAFPDKNTGVGCHFLLQGIFSVQARNPCLPASPASPAGSCLLSHGWRCSGACQVSSCVHHWELFAFPFVGPGLKCLSLDQGPDESPVSPILLTPGPNFYFCIWTSCSFLGS